ncbi:glycine zipper 2TM domain-containing protein [Brevundimonas sp. S30B]|uniref:glycine zipper 2TM domain-containing protein n=1 Tax=unclassified Brevundimonas TaxID=2622653 RepID=UPI001071DC5A|nr:MULTISPECIES: glycine zipper 2TM domain-containing protein [unclassified Brevundimonas]QBX37711.1 glycine zipper 2TM domain-containing protein [Brevundimonas sp. MF30-B]TFW00575.1 glycine zipper 2TM domain-containing protein [Brevundimonas sp. S30B]
MSFIANLPRNAAVAAAALAALAAAAPASAQSYGYSQPYGYGSSYGSSSYGYGDPCVRERDGRTGAGAVIGGVLGAVAGSQVAARGRRTEGSVLGGVLGAVVGGSVGRNNSSAYCDTRAYDNRAGDYDYYGQNYGYDRYEDRAYSPPPVRYEERRYDGYDDRYAGVTGYPSGGWQDQSGCRLAESRIRLPDGRTDTRYVRTCPDQYGRYRVVD